MVEEAYVSFETAKLMKEKGFDEKCSSVWRFTSNSPKGNGEWILYGYNMADEYSIWNPTLQMAMKWLREKYNIYISIQPDFPSEIGYKMCWCWSANILHENCISMKRHQCYIETYEEAAEAAIKYCLEYLI